MILMFSVVIIFTANFESFEDNSERWMPFFVTEKLDTYLSRASSGLQIVGKKTL